MPSSRTTAARLGNVRLFHWRPEEAKALIASLRAAGYQVIYSAKTQSPSVREMRESGVVAVVIDLSRMPSHGRYVAAWVRGSKGTRHIPIVFVGGVPEKVEAIRKEIPDAAYVSPTRLIQTLKSVKPPRDPVVPRQMMETDPARTAAQKLGIREGMTVALIDPPTDYARVIGPLPKGVELDEDSLEGVARGAQPVRGEQPVTLWFVHDPGEFEAALPSCRALASKSRLWIVWQKGRRDALNGNFVRQRALEMGLVDYKICSLDGAWSGMVFAVKKL